MFEDRERWIDVEEAASYLGVKPETIRTWIKAKNLPAQKIGRRWKLKLDAIDVWVEGGQANVK